MIKAKIGIIIATSMKRIEELFNRSLKSVLSQTVPPNCIVVIDDNTNNTVSDEIKKRICSLQNPLVHYIPNCHTKNMSGTGAWNTGIEFLAKKLGTDSYFAILDDDDSWDENYLEKIYSTIDKNSNINATFAFLKRSDLEKVSTFSIKDLTIKNFLIGNPGIQGSNMCFKTASILEIGGFDEQLASCTDRDLMIRFLEKYGNQKIVIIPQKLVNHFAGDNTVTSDIMKKQEGLNYFYKKHLNLFDITTLKDSLIRAEKLFQYSGRKKIMTYFYENQTIVIGIAIHNNRKTIHRCLSSALKQINCKRQLIFVLADDNSSDQWKEEIPDLLSDPRIIQLHFTNKNVVKTRNMINDYIKSNIENCILIGRLDADDEYASPTVLSEIEKIFDAENPDLILAGNYLRENEKIIDRKNIATKKFESQDYVLERLKQMSENNPAGELPSCNIFLTPQIMKPYPKKESGEDHALLAYYLMRQDKYKISFATDVLLTIYNLSGNQTSDNKKEETYIKCRNEIYSEALNLYNQQNS